MAAKQMLDAGNVNEAERALKAWLREHPSDSAQRTFLFELLCFSGAYDRARRHLAILAEDGPDQKLGAMLYFSALHAEEIRHNLFRTYEADAPASPPPPGLLNGKRFQSITDADPRIGARLEVFAAGSFLRIPFIHLATLKIEQPRRLRDTLWAPGAVATVAHSQTSGLRDVLVPAVYPYSWRAEDQQLWLGRKTAQIVNSEGLEQTLGQRLLLVDGEEVPLLEIRSLEFDTVPEPPHAVA